jgi:6-phosphogluconolactonase (cycloisomerase 2 family)
MPHTRRGFLRGATAVAGSALLTHRVWAEMSQTSYFACVGSRTTRERNARGDGINVYRVDARSGKWTHVHHEKGELPNPSYLAFDRTRRFLYTVHGDFSDVSAYRFDPQTGALSFINHVSTGGKNSVHLTIDATNRFVVVANHLSSNLVVIPRQEDGSLGELIDTATLTGPIGPHRVEQPFSKPHQVEFDRTDRVIVVPDKGLDQVFAFRLDATSGKLQQVEPRAPRSREGAGPRHVTFHPSNAYAYVVNELDSTVTAYKFDANSGSLTPFQILTTLPDSFVANSRAAEIAIAPNGRFVYASNRGHDSVAVFRVEQTTGRLAHAGWHESRGKTPRFFAFDAAGRFLYVANEDSDTIVAFNADASSGKLSPTGEIVHTGSPVCIVFAPAS